MDFPKEQVAELEEICSGTQRYEEAGISYFFLPQMRTPDGCSPQQVDVLLCPTSHHGYTSRLFLAERITSRESLNWSTQARIMERIWHAISWNIPETNLRLAQILALQLRAFR
jgi:hypothetical protein